MKENSSRVDDSQSELTSQKPLVPSHAIIGIIAVLLSALNSSIGAGLISNGLADLRGAWGLGIDEGAYISTAFGAAQMFMGPLAIILAARYGHRKVLMHAGYIYILSTLILPLVPHMVPTYLLLIIGGLSSGTFYPLTLSFIVRNLPIGLVPYGVAAYTMDLLGTSHVVYLLEDFYVTHWSWHWLFWNQSLFTIPMLLCVYFGITRTPKNQLIPQCSYTGVLYVSGGLTALYIALDQGERLDWYNNGLINGLLVSGVLLLLAALLHRKFTPNPFLDLRYLRTRNIIILGFLIVTFRMILLRSVAVLPQFLERVHQYRPQEIGNLLVLSLAPYLVALPTTAYFMKKVHVRIILTFGFLIVGIINYFDSKTISTEIGNDFVVQQVIGSVALCMVVLAVMSGTVFEGRLSGAYKIPAGAYCQGAFFQIVRLFGSEASASLVRRFVQIREHFWHTKLVASVTANNQFNDRISHLAGALAPQAAGPLQSADIAAGLVASSVQTQSFTLAIDDTFMILSTISLLSLVAVFFMKPIPLPHQLPDA